MKKTSSFKRMTGSLAIVAGMMLGVGSAGAITYFDIEFEGVLMSDANQTHSGSFNILDYGYDPASQQVVDASAYFLFSDDMYPWKDALDWSSSYKEWVQVDLAGGGNTQSLPTIEVDLLSVSGGSVGGSLLLDLSATGILSYQVNQVSGDFWFVAAKLYAEAENTSINTQPVTRVPDGGATLGLLGLGLLGLGAALRKSRK